MPYLIFYTTDGTITRALSSSLPKSQWQLKSYGLELDEAMKLFDDSELPADFRTSSYKFDGTNFTPLPVVDWQAEWDAALSADKVKVLARMLGINTGPEADKG